VDFDALDIGAGPLIDHQRDADAPRAGISRDAGRSLGEG